MGGSKPSFMDRVERRIVVEIRYCAGILCMFEERNREYRANFNRAAIRGNSKGMEEITEDLATFQHEMDVLAAKQTSASARLKTLHAGEAFVNAPEHMHGQQCAGCTLPEQQNDPQRP